VGTPRGMAEGLERIVATEELSGLQAKLFGSGKPISTVSDELGVKVLKTNAAVVAGWGPLGIKDMLGVLAVDPGGSIVTLVVPQRKVVATTPARTQTWARLAAHLAAAHRLRRWARNGKLAEISSFADAEGVAEAVLTPDGRIQHALDAAKPLVARAALRAAAVAIDRAKAVRRRSPSQAVALWRALVEARWSLVDQFDRDGRHFLVACRNDVKVLGLKSLSSRERQVASFCALGHSNKLIAYELGLSVSTVSTHLHRAMRKLGARSRLEFIAATRSLPQRF